MRAHDWIGGTLVLLALADGCSEVIGADWGPYRAHQRTSLQDSGLDGTAIDADAFQDAAQSAETGAGGGAAIGNGGLGAVGGLGGSLATDGGNGGEPTDSGKPAAGGTLSAGGASSGGSGQGGDTSAGGVVGSGGAGTGGAPPVCTYGSKQCSGAIVQNCDLDGWHLMQLCSSPQQTCQDGACCVAKFYPCIGQKCCAGTTCSYSQTYQNNVCQ